MTAMVKMMLLDASQVAYRLGVHPSTIRRWMKSKGELPKPLPVRAVDGGPLWLASDVDRWRAGRLRGAKPGADTESPRKLRLVR